MRLHHNVKQITIRLKKLLHGKAKCDHALTFLHLIVDLIMAEQRFQKHIVVINVTRLTRVDGVTLIATMCL